MMKQAPLKFNKGLFLFSWLYSFIIYVRNKLFDCNILKSQEYDIPIICVGNLTAGGTGKTPHTEYLISILKDKFRVAVVSRGYKRKTKGFVLADTNSTANDIGDEPYQIFSKNTDIILAVDKNRRRAISSLLNLKTPPQVIILDDGFQHRYVKPSYSIILSNYNRPIYRDKMLPVGLLRDSLRRLEKSTDVIVTKCPVDLKPIDYRIISHDIDLLPFQGLFYTNIEYFSLLPVFDKKSEALELDSLKNKSILLVSGIASPLPIIKKIYQYTNKLVTLNFSDHHNFSKKDIKKIFATYSNIESSKKIVIVTEKDAARLRLITNLPDELKENMYYLPIKIQFSSSDDQSKFNNKIINHVKDYSRNSRLY